MKLPIYTVIELGKMLQGGTTQPLVARVIDKEKNYQEDEYVVKIFKSSNLKQQLTNKEFYANALAVEFGLYVPDAAFLLVEEETIQQLEKREKYANFNLEPGYYFGSIYLDPHISYEFIQIENYELENLATIFAFDMLIRNIDRRTEKPNIISHDGSFCLIDHELTLNVQKDCSFYLSPSKWDVFTKYDVGKKGEHIFYNHLKKIHQQNPIDFESFRFSLNNLRPRTLLSSIAAQLAKLEHNSDDVFDIINYLECVQKHQKEFVDLLKKLLA